MEFPGSWRSSFPPCSSSTSPPPFPGRSSLLGSFFPGTDPSLCNNGSKSVFLSLFSQIICLQIRMAAAPDSTAVTTSDQLKRQDLTQILSTFTGNTKRYKKWHSTTSFPRQLLLGGEHYEGGRPSQVCWSLVLLVLLPETRDVQAFIQFRPCDLRVQVGEVPRCWMSNLFSEFYKSIF